MDYRIYNPVVTTTTVVDPYDNPADLTYVSNSSLAEHGGKLWAIMDGTTEGFVEASDGQQIWLVTSDDDGATWSDPCRPFRDADYCTNPVTGTDLDWQPNLVVVGDELWCTWCGADGYISKLSDPDGLWTNYRFEFIGEQVFISSTVTGAATSGRSLRATFDGITDWYPFFATNPITLSTGVTVCPLTFRSNTASVQTPAVNSFTKQLKQNALIKTADGTSWSMIRVDTSAFGDFCAWEPFAVENPVGHVYVYSRNLDARVDDVDFLLVARSVDGAASFNASVSSGMLVPSTRGFARRVGARWIMTHVDHPQNSNNNPDQALSSNVRRNGAIFTSRRGVPDFSPGVNFSGDELVMNYPQFITKDDSLLINYTSGVGPEPRRSLKLVHVSPLPSDTYAYIHPRSVGLYNSATPFDPTLISDATPPYYSFAGINRLWSTTTLAASTGVTYAAWITPTTGDVIMDSRQANTAAFGQVLTTRGLSINGLNFFHGHTIAVGQPIFVMATVDNSAQTVTVRAASGDADFATVTGYYHSVLFSGLPTDGQTITVNAVVYTFRTSASLTNDVQIGASAATTAANLSTKLNANSMTAAVPADGARVIMARTDLATFAATTSATNVAVESSVPLNGGPVSFGMKAPATSSLTALVGKMFEGRIYASALSVANARSLYNHLAAGFGYAAISGTSTPPGSPFLFLDPTDPDVGEFPSVGQAARCELTDATTLRIDGEGSASCELPYGATQVNLRFKLGAIPAATDKYVVATFGDGSAPARLYVDADDPNGLYLEGRLVATLADPTAYNTVTVMVSTGKVAIGAVEYYAAGKPRLFLGSAYPEALLSSDKTITFDVSVMRAVRAT